MKTGENPMRLPLRYPLAAGLGVFGLWVVVANVGASYLLRRRRPHNPDSPANYGIRYEEAHFASRDNVKLYGWWIPAQNATRTIVICHGQEGNMDGYTPLMVPLHEAGYNVFMFDFRAHGRSEGEFVSMGMYEKEDLLGAIDFLYQQYGIKQVGLLGFSMGAATALIAAALSDRICTIIADSSFARLRGSLTNWAMNKGVPRYIARQVAWSILAVASVRTEGRVDQTDPLRWIPHIGRRPILFIYGSNDQFITKPEVTQMASLADGPVKTWIVDGVGHRGAYSADPADYMERVIDWFNQYLEPHS